MTGGPENLQSRFGLGQVTTDFLFDDEQPEKNHSSTKDSTTSPGIKSYLQMVDTVDKFPILTQSHPGKVSSLLLHVANICCKQLAHLIV
jgi:hypothetical protein